MLIMIKMIFFILVFIFGMAVLRFGLASLSGDALKHQLILVTNTPWKGMLIGTFMTAILQSSSAVMVIIIGLISAKMLTFPQSIGVILGTNIGTTITTEMITFNLDHYLIPLVFLGTIFIIFPKKNIRSIGLVMIGISTVFAAMRGFKFLAIPLTTLPYMENIFQAMSEHYVFAIFIGAGLTAIIQSSTAMTGIAMGLLSGNVLNIGAGIAVMLGANIGTCMTALLASIGAGKESKLCAYAHIWLNVIGVLVFSPFITDLASVAPYLSNDTATQLAHISVLFNIVSSLIVLPFSKSFGNMIIKIHGK